MITCVLPQRISQYCTTPHMEQGPNPQQWQSGHYPTHSGQDNEQSDKKGGCFRRHRKVWRILSDGELDFVPQQRRLSARRNVILNSVWWLIWIDSKGVSTVYLHMIIVHVECGVICASQDSKHYSIKIRTFLLTTKERESTVNYAAVTHPTCHRSHLLLWVKQLVGNNSALGCSGKRGFTTRFRVEHRAFSEWTSFVSRGGFVT